MSDAPNKGGRPRKYAAAAGRVAERFAEAQRLEAERDRFALECESRNTVTSKAELLRLEMLVAQAWASALRADGKVGPALKYTEAAVKIAGAHKAALDQIIADRVAELHQRVTRRARAAELLAADLEGKP